MDFQVQTFIAENWRQALVVLLLASAAGPVVRWLSELLKVMQQARGKPGYVALFPPFEFNGNSAVWSLKEQLYTQFNSTVLVIPSIFPPKLTYLVNDPEAFNLANSHRDFAKTTASNHVLVYMFGQNIVNTDGEDWRRERKIVAPSFSERNNSAVWDETTRILDNDLLPRIDASAKAGGIAVLDDFEEVIATTTLMVIGQAGFGQRIKWPEVDSEVSIPFYHALRTVLRDFIPKLLLPEWAWKFSAHSTYLSRVDAGYKEFERALKAIIAERRADVDRSDRNDLLAALCAANEGEEGKAKLSDTELVSNCYLFLLAGHETTANSIAATFFYLALYPEHQAAIYEEASAVFGAEQPIAETSYAVYSSLPYTLATYQEGLRVFPPGPVVVKKAMRDTSLPMHTTPNDGSAPVRSMIHVPEGSIIRESIHGVSYNPRVFADPYEFRPTRFLDGSTEMQNWLPFSSGPRGCIGRQFAMTEGVALIAAIVSRYEVQIPTHLAAEWARKEGESEEGRRQRILKPDMIAAMRPDHLSLQFKRRTSATVVAKTAPAEA